MIADLAAQARRQGRLAIDTEFVSERRYQALLCLVQVAVPDPDAPEGVRTEVLDPLADEPFDPAPLAAVLADPEVEILMHAGRQDVAILRRAWQTEIHTIFDTQVAAGFLGLGNQEGYESLVRKVLNVRLKGSEGFTKWDRRPLTPQQLSYAGDDARMLLALAEEIERRLDERGRLEWAREECRALERISDERDPQDVYERLPRLGRLDDRRAGGRARAGRVARADGARDGPPGRLRAARPGADRARSAHAQEPRGARADPRPAASRPCTAARASCWPRSSAAPSASRRPRRPSRPRATRADAPLVSLAQALVRHRSQESGVAVELIATQSELAALVSANSARRRRDQTCA